MCGIAGILRLDGQAVECADIKSMTDAISHRGPDGEGQWCEGSVGFGHRRLAIIDLTAEASQPMHSLDGRYVITYNGEVYNFRELRRELEKSGSRFRSQSDTEVVLEAVIRWGIDSSIRRFNGMFAFAIWDRQTQSLLLGRDRYGIKPLYIWTTPDHLAFASEPKAFRVLPQFAPVLDAHGLAEYFTFQNILTDRTFLEGVKVFPAGYWARLFVTENQSALQKFQYWDFDFQEPETPASEGEYAEELRRLLAQAVDRQLVSDVEVGAYLSGGLDSGSIVALASQRLPNMKTFTIGFELDDVAEHERHFDERAAAEAIAAASGTTQIEMILGPRHIASCLPRLAFHMEEPRVGQSYPNYYAAQLASSFVKVTLAGTGGDEVLGGYPWRYPDVSMAPDSFGEWHFRVWNRLLDHDEMGRLLRTIQPQVGWFDPRTLHATILDSCLRYEGDPLNAALYFEAKTFLPGLLAVEDRLSMAHGLEVRVPFLDNDLVDFCQVLPRYQRLSVSSRWRDVEAEKGSVRVGKRLLRQAMSPFLSPEVLSRAKQGFSAPDSRWLSHQTSRLLENALDELAMFGLDRDAVLELLAPPHSNDGRRRLLAWSLLASSMHLRDCDPQRAGRSHKETT